MKGTLLNTDVAGDLDTQASDSIFCCCFESEFDFKYWIPCRVGYCVFSCSGFRTIGKP